MLIIIIINMRVRHKVSISNNHQQPILTERKRLEINTPLKSPSPDKKNSSIIPNTPSPEIYENTVISLGKKEPITNTISKKVGHKQKNYGNFSEQTEGKEQMGWIANMSSEITGRKTSLKNVEQTMRSQRNCERNAEWDLSIYDKSCSPSQLDYLRIIREKQQTIKQFRELLEQMDKQSAINHPIDEQKLKKADKMIKEYQKQIRILQVENQCLINVIQNNQINLPSQKEAILQREIAELRQSLKLKQEEAEQTRHCSQNVSQKLLHLELSNKQLTQHNQELEIQCEKLVKLMKQKTELEKSKQMGYSSQIRRSQKLSLNLIRQQYNQNLALMKSSFWADLEKISEAYNKKVQKAKSQIDQLTRRVKVFEENKQKMTKKMQKEPALKEKKKEQNLEIQFLLEKYQKTEKDLQVQKSINQKLSTQLQVAQQTLRIIETRSFQVSQILESSDRMNKLKDLKKPDQIIPELETQIKRLKEQNSELKNKLKEVEASRQKQIKNNQLKLQTVVTCYQNQLKERRTSIDDKINELEQNYLSELVNLKHAIQEAHSENYQLKREKEYWNDEYKKISLLFEQEIKEKNILIQLLQRELEKIDQQAKHRKSQKQLINRQLDSSILAQLSQLKKDIELLNLKINQQNQLISQYESVDVQLEFKIQENQRLMNELQLLRNDVQRYQKEQNALQQKINSLQRTLSQREHEAKQTKIMCDQLFIDRTKMQKQAIMNNKLKFANLEHKRASSSFQQISHLLDKLISTERQSRRKMQAFQQQ